MTELANLYRRRFEDTGLEKRQAVWRVLCEAFFDKLVPAGAAVLDIGCGYGEFINQVRAGSKAAVDMNPDAPTHLKPEVRFVQTPATDLSAFGDNSIDVAFTSNFLEHLRSKEECSEVFTEVGRVLRPGGRFILMGPNIRFAYREYWDFFDHHLPLSDRSVAEGLIAAGFEPERVVARFLPFSMANNRPTAEFLIRGYLAFPLAWKIMGKQFLIVAGKPA
jgi:ubiquinone/menaquinone biosynthesis C-methylase UbiE